MAQPKVGTQEVAFLWGAVQTARMQLRDISRPGTDGHGYAQDGQKAPISELRTMTDCDSAADAETLYAAYLAMVGDDPVTITYANGQTVANVMLLDCVRWKQPQEVVNPVGSTLVTDGTRLLWARWLVQHRGD